MPNVELSKIDYLSSLSEKLTTDPSFDITSVPLLQEILKLDQYMPLAILTILLVIVAILIFSLKKLDDELRNVHWLCVAVPAGIATVVLTAFTLGTSVDAYRATFSPRQHLARTLDLRVEALRRDR